MFSSSIWIGAACTEYSVSYPVAPPLQLLCFLSNGDNGLHIYCKNHINMPQTLKKCKIFCTTRSQPFSKIPHNKSIWLINMFWSHQTMPHNVLTGPVVSLYGDLTQCWEKQSIDHFSRHKTPIHTASSWHFGGTGDFIGNYVCAISVQTNTKDM